MYMKSHLFLHNSINENVICEAVAIWLRLIRLNNFIIGGNEYEMGQYKSHVSTFILSAILEYGRSCKYLADNIS